MKSGLKIESISGVIANVYSMIARKNPFLKDLYEKIAEDITSRISSGRILDVGTGPGYLVFEIAKKSQSLDIVGIDISKDMIEIAKRNAENVRGSHSVRFQFGDVSKLPFEDEYFDFIVSTLSLHHWPKPVESINEIYRVLKRNCEVWIYDIRRDASEEVITQIRKRYGWIFSFLFSNIVRFHYFFTLEEAKNILYSSEIKFSSKYIDEEGIVFKLRLLK
ncbi:MAG: class I SAM-dependent methyltransferase [Brevinematia bacterium]